MAATPLTEDPKAVERLLTPMVRLLTSYLDGPGTLGAAAGFSEQNLESLYALGHQLYQAGRYDEALKLFSFVTLHNHVEKRYLIATAATLQLLERPSEALGFYGMASFMDPNDPVPTFHGCECLIALGQTDEALEGLASAIADCQPQRHDALRQRALGLQALLERKLKQEGSTA
ncbi:MAG: SycD/LcrH family type III secretion system chaperone [Pseudomonadota bacterium]